MNRDVTLDNYEEKRRRLLAENTNLHGIVLREQEERLNTLLSAMKEEYRGISDESRYTVPVLTDETLWQSRLYRFCARLPKGGDLHVHDMTLLPLHELIPVLEQYPPLCINADRRSFDLIEADPAKEPPTGYMRFAFALQSGYYSYHDLLQNWTVAGAGSSTDIWAYFENLFERQGVLSDNPAFSAVYYERAFRYYCSQHIMHVEIHLMLTRDLDTAAETVRVIRQAYYHVKQEYPFFTVRIIGAGVKDDNTSIDFTRRCFLNASYAQEVVKDESDPAHVTNFVIGFDLVCEEDTHLPLKAFVPMLLKVKQRYPEMDLYIHCGESLEASNENLVDAYLLGASRVGHGFNLYRFPELHTRFITAEICLEVCPISNQRLRYASDIRNHPAIEYLRSGTTVALCSDDPTYMEYNALTDDFFAAVVGWNLSLADLKQLGVNSILYSGLDEVTKYKSLHSYNTQWNEFVEEMLNLSH